MIVLSLVVKLFIIKSVFSSCSGSFYVESLSFYIYIVFVITDNDD